MRVLLTLQKLSDNTTDHEVINLGKNQELVNIQDNDSITELTEII